jgi:hypothetical protein
MSATLQLPYTRVSTFPTGSIAGRSTAGTGFLEALTPGAGLTLAAGVLSAAVASVAGRTGAVTLTKSDVGLAAVENTALSTWPGSANITTLGTIGTGVWNGTSVTSPFLNVTGDWPINSHKITSAADPTQAQDLATKNYVDTAIQGLDVKTSCVAATTANIALTGTQTIDGIAVTAGQRVLVKNQSTGSQNGIYVVASGAWSRSTDAVQGELLSGAYTFVETGTVNGATGWTLTTADPLTIGTTALTFTQFAGAGTYTAGAGLTLTGTQFSVGTGQITNTMLAGSVAASKLVGTDIATVGTITSGIWHGTALGLLYGGTNADLSATGGASKFLKQASAGAAITVVQVADADLSVTNVTTNNVSITAHGFAPIAPNDATKYLDGTGVYSIPAGGGSTPGNPTASVGLAAVNGSASTYLRSDGAPALSVAIAPTWTGQHIFAQTIGTTTQPVKVLGKASQSVENWRSTLGTSQTGNHLSCYNSDDSTLTLALSSAGKITTYNAVATAGIGLPPIVATGRAVGVSAQQTSLCTFTPTADSSFLVWANVNLTTLGSANFQVDVTFTDETNTARTQILQFIKDNAASTSFSIVTNAVSYNGTAVSIRVKANTAVTIKTNAGTYTSCVYNIEGFILQIN